MKDTIVQDGRKMMRGWPARAAAVCAVMAAMPLMAANFPNQIKWGPDYHLHNAGRLSAKCGIFTGPGQPEAPHFP